MRKQVCMRPRAVSRRRGAIVVLVAILLVVLFVFVAFAIDVGFIAHEKTRLQATADACALAAVVELPEQAGVNAMALNYAIKNYPDMDGVLDTKDIEPGYWDTDTATFTLSSVLNANALRITVRRDADKGKGLRLLFAPVMGRSEAGVAASAIAIKESDCFGKGIVANNRVTIGEEPSINGYCVYGRNQVRLGEEAQVLGESRIGSLDKSNISWGEEPVGLPEKIIELDMRADLAEGLSTFISGLEGGHLPPQITLVETLSKLPKAKDIRDGTAYLIQGDVHIGEEIRAENVIIIAKGTDGTNGDVTWGEEGAIVNSGDPELDAAFGIYATRDIELDEEFLAQGVNLLAGRNVTIGEEATLVDTTVEALNDIRIGEELSATRTSSRYSHSSGNEPKSTAKLVQ